MCKCNTGLPASRDRLGSEACRRDPNHISELLIVCRGRPTDVYALGACLYTFVFGRIPFNAPNVFKLFQVVQHEPLRFPETPVVSHDLKDLLLKMLCKASHFHSA